MKQKSVFLVFFLIVFHTLFFAQNSRSEKISLEILEKYNKDGYFILTEYIKAPSSYTFENSSTSFSKNMKFSMFIHGKLKQDIINSLGTVVHEMNHAFTGIYAFQKIKQYDLNSDFDCIFIKNDLYYIVKHTETFPSRLIASSIPDELKTFRFKTYISESSKYQSTQSSGIYGLLDEFNSYYQGSKNDYLMYDYYKNETQGSAEDWQYYMSNFDGSYYAYTEFRFYILQYLIYAEKNKNEIYEGIMNNKEFKQAFNSVDKEFSYLIESYFKRREEILKTFEETGHEVKIGEKFTYIDGFGTGNFMDVYEMLITEMKKPQYIAVVEELQK